MVEEPKRSPPPPFEPLSFSSASAHPPPGEPESTPGASVPSSPDGTSTLSMRAQLQSAFDGVYRIGEMIDRGQCSTTFVATAVASKERVALKVLQLDAAVEPALV